MAQCNTEWFYNMYGKDLAMTVGSDSLAYWNV